MEICTGIKAIEELRRYIKAGATEFYCGLIDDLWLRQYNYSVPLNRRPWKEANFATFAELREAIDIAHSNNCKVFFTLNEHCYNTKQIEVIKKYIEKLISSSVDAIIISDIALVEVIKLSGFKNEIHMSTGGLVFNQSAVRFYKEKMEVDRVILPRSLSIEEINEISDNVVGIDYEIFLKNEGCTYIDGYCNFIHGVLYRTQDRLINYNPPCEVRYKVLDITGNSDKSDYDIVENRLNRVLTSKANCGLCALYKMHREHIKSLKIVSRDSNVDKIVADIEQARETIRLCDEIDDYNEFCREIQTKNCKNDCDKNIIYCYYPEILKDIKH